METAIDDTGKTILPETTGQRGYCPACGSLVISVCPDEEVGIKNHWRHRGDRGTIEGYCPEEASYDRKDKASPWHKRWQRIVQKEHIEQKRIAIDGSEHFADIVGNGGIIIELQHSTSIPPEVIRERETVYGNMIWLLDSNTFLKNTEVKCKNGTATYFIDGRHKKVGLFKKPVFIHLPCGAIMKVDERRSGVLQGHIVFWKDFVDQHLSEVLAIKYPGLYPPNVDEFCPRERKERYQLYEIAKDNGDELSRSKLKFFPLCLYDDYVDFHSLKNDSPKYQVKTPEYWTDYKKKESEAKYYGKRYYDSQYYININAQHNPGNQAALEPLIISPYNELTIQRFLSSRGFMIEPAALLQLKEREDLIKKLPAYLELNSQKFLITVKDIQEISILNEPQSLEATMDEILELESRLNILTSKLAYCFDDIDMNDNSGGMIWNYPNYKYEPPAEIIIKPFPKSVKYKHKPNPEKRELAIPAKSCRFRDGLACKFYGGNCPDVGRCLIEPVPEEAPTDNQVKYT